jgi:predicted DNA-binding antitoxin AbrB/MazE fold protein
MGKRNEAMARTMKVIYEKGVLKPVGRLNLAEHQEVEIIILGKDDDLPAAAIAALALGNKSFEFLADPGEDVYTAQDGEPV